MVNDTESGGKSAPQDNTAEIQNLLKRLAELGYKADGNSAQESVRQETGQPGTGSPKLNPEMKQAFDEYLKSRTVNSAEDDSDEDEDDPFEGDVFWNPGPEWETIGYVAGGAALVGLGALLYHWLKD